MIPYVTVGTNNLEKSVAFYDELFAGMAGKKVVETERLVMWSIGERKDSFAVAKPFDGESATVGNGAMISLGVKGTDKVDELHAKALSLGAKDEGAPGLRAETYYMGYFRDLDGNKLAFLNVK